MVRRKRILISLPYNASTNKYDRYFPLPMGILEIKSKDDVLIDLNLESYKKKKIDIYKILNKNIQYINKSKIKKIIIQCGDFPPDADKFEFFEYYIKRIRNKNIEVIGPYNILNKFKKIKKRRNKIFTKNIPINIINKYPKVDKKLKVNINFSQGCPRKCNYCPTRLIYSGKYIIHPVNETIKKIKNYHDLGVRFFNFIDDNISANTKKFKELLEEIKKENFKKDVCFQSQEGFEVKALNDPVICKLLKETNWKNIKIGVENISDKFLEKIEKSHRFKDILKTIENIKKYDLKTTVYYLINTNDKKEDILENYKFFSKYNLNIRINIIRNYKGTTNKTNKELTKLKAFGYAVAWLSHDKKIDIFNSSISEVLSKLNIIMNKQNNNYIFTGKINIGFKQSKLILILKYFIGDNFKINISKNSIDFIYKVTK